MPGVFPDLRPIRNDIFWLLALKNSPNTTKKHQKTSKIVPKAPLGGLCSLVTSARFSRFWALKFQVFDRFESYSWMWVPTGQIYEKCGKNVFWDQKSSKKCDLEPFSCSNRPKKLFWTKKKFRFFSEKKIFFSSFFEKKNFFFEKNRNFFWSQKNS